MHRFVSDCVKVLDIAVSGDGKLLHPPGGDVSAVAFFGDGEHLYSGSPDGTVRRWELAALVGYLNRATDVAGGNVGSAGE